MALPHVRLLRRAGAFAAAVLAMGACGPPGEHAALLSQVLDERRPLLIRLPDGYEDTTRAYPVLYVLDAWATSRLETWRPILREVEASGVGDLIVVGLVNTDRSRDMLPACAHSPDESGADVFLRFLALELIPWVEARYRASARRVLFGRSDSGLFAVYAFVSAPETFTSYIAASPTLGYCPHLIPGRAEEILRSGRAEGRALCVVYGERDIPLSRGSLPAFEALLADQSPASLRWTVRQVPGAGHLPEGALTSGLRFVFADH